MFSVPAFAAMMNFTGMNLNHPGIRWAWKINADQYTFVVNTTSNYDMQNVVFNKDTKTLTFLGNSPHDGNVAEIEIPSNLIGGKYKVYKNVALISPIVLKNGFLSKIFTFIGTYIFFSMIALSLTHSDPTHSQVYLYAFYQAGIVGGIFYGLNKFTTRSNMWEDYMNGY